MFNNNKSYCGDSNELLFPALTSSWNWPHKTRSSRSNWNSSSSGSVINKISTLSHLVPCRLTERPKSRRRNNRAWVKTRFINKRWWGEPEGVSERRGSWLLKVWGNWLGSFLQRPGGGQCGGELLAVVQRFWACGGASRQVWWCW